MRTFIMNDAGGSTIEWTLLLAAIGLPSYFIITWTLGMLIDYYRMMTMINGLPFP